MSYAWIDAAAGLTIEVLIRRKSDMAVWDGDSWEADSTLTDAQLEACAIAATAVTNSETTHIGYKVDIPAGVTVEADLFGYSGGYTAGNAATWQGEYLPLTKSEMNDAFTEIKGATWDSGTDTLEALRNRGDAAWATATSVSVSDKTGFKLASDGLDSVATTAPTGVASNFREMVVQTWRRLFKKATQTSTELKTYADDGTTAITTQTLSDDGTTQTQGESS